MVNMQKWNILKTENDYKGAVERLDEIFEVAPGELFFEEAELLGLLINEYEDVHFPISSPDPLEAVKFKMDELGLKSKDLQPYIGSKSYVSAILNGKREITLRIASVLHQKLGIPAEVFLKVTID